MKKFLSDAVSDSRFLRNGAASSYGLLPGEADALHDSGRALPFAPSQVGALSYAQAVLERRLRFARKQLYQRTRKR